jgi:hypothetical protein
MSPESTSGSPDSELRFDQSPEVGVAAPACARCAQAIESQYYEAGGSIICADCRTALQSEAGAGSAGGRVSRALVYGLGGAFAGAALYYAILALTGYEIGLVAIAVGWLVGRAVQLGSRHRGGRVYQVLAVGLTYLAIVSTYIPFIFSGSFEFPTVSAAGSMLLLAIAAPFLAGFENVIGILIIGFALWQAWQMNAFRPVVITGPYAVGGRAAAVPQVS